MDWKTIQPSDGTYKDKKTLPGFNYREFFFAGYLWNAKALRVLPGQGKNHSAVSRSSLLQDRAGSEEPGYIQMLLAGRESNLEGRFG
jgi:hypothetical protein